ncbi:MAG: helix-turn-helix transcriptional regulator [Hyphomicrobiaceae bacterium]|nr:helix-turn-helix transcriptional regulator [Hyphomicrobiaceae bacterium]
MDDDTESKSSRRPNPVDVHVGSRVRLRRMLLGISQEKLGERLGLTFQQVQKYEKGVNRIGASRLYDLCNVLSVPVSFFYEGLASNEARLQPTPGFAEAPTEANILEFLSTREGLELNKAFARIQDAKTRRAILELVRALAGLDGDALPE